MIEIKEWADQITAVIEGQLRMWSGLTVSVCGALLASSDILNDGPTRHTVAAVCIISTAVHGYFLRRPPQA